MGAILVKPADEEEYRLITQLFKKMRIKTENFSEEDIKDISAYDKAMRRIEMGEDSFLPAESVFEQIEAKRNSN
jgi:hypothetical protein